MEFWILFTIFLAVLGSYFVVYSPSWIGGVVSTAWIAWLYRQELLKRIERFPSGDPRYPTSRERQSLSALAFACIPSGILIGIVVPPYLSTGPFWTELLEVLGIVLIFPIGLSLLFIFCLRNFSLSFGFTASAIVLHALVLRQPTVFKNNDATKLLVVAYLVLAFWFIGRGVFVVQEHKSNMKHSPILRIGGISIELEQGALIRYTVGALEALITIIEFFNIMYDLYVLTQ